MVIYVYILIPSDSTVMKFEGPREGPIWGDPIPFWDQGPQYTVRLWEYGMTGWLENCPQLASLAFISIRIIRIIRIIENH